MVVERCTRESFEDWLRLRQALWPQASGQELRLEAAAMLDRPDDTLAFIARDERSNVVAFAEATLRHDYVNGCSTSPVAFLEGIYVQPQWRNRGLARLLCNTVEDWAAGLGCAEFASDVTRSFATGAPSAWSTTAKSSRAEQDLEANGVSA